MDEDGLAADPLTQLAAWLEDARAACPQPDAMTLATADADGRPSARQVLLRGLDERGLVFYTNRSSRKARELAENPRAALVFHWYEQGRQVRVEGTVDQVHPAESEAYWRSRPREPARGLGVSAVGADRGRRSSTACSPRSARSSRAMTFRSLPSGAATGSCPTRSSSGSTTTTACTIAFGTRGQGRAGAESGSRPRERRCRLRRGLRRREGAVGVQAFGVPQEVTLRSREPRGSYLRAHLVDPVLPLEAEVLHPRDEERVATADGASEVPKGERHSCTGRGARILERELAGPNNDGYVIACTASSDGAMRRGIWPMPRSRAAESPKTAADMRTPNGSRRRLA